MTKVRAGAVLVILLMPAVIERPASAITITGYTPEVNDRFSSGYPAMPVTNTGSAFIGAGTSWLGVGWAASDPTKSFSFVTPRHYLVARHYGGAATINFLGADGQVHTGTQASVTATGYGYAPGNQAVGDLSIGALTTPVSRGRGLPRYGVLDLNATSTTSSSYDGQPLWVYGCGTDGTLSPRIGAATINGTTVAGNTSTISTNGRNILLDYGDSGSPAFIPWTDPDGVTELTIIGNAAATDFATINIFNFLGGGPVIAAVNGITTPDGFALKVVGDPAATWQGGFGTPDQRNDLGLAANWSGGAVPTDRYGQFTGDSAFRVVDVDVATEFRGLYFAATGTGGGGFTLAGASPLTIGRGGVTNYDSRRQAIDAPIALGDHQYWDVGPGGITAAAIDTAGRLLEIAGSGTARITGAVSGAGGLALTGNRLELSARGSYTGGTWAHDGTLAVDGSIATSSGVVIDAPATLGGTGEVAALSGAGSVAPGEGPGILTAPSVDPAGGLDFSFEFTRIGSPDYAAAAASGNDVLRLTGSNPFAAALTADNAIDVFFNVPALFAGDAFRGGFFAPFPFADRVGEAALHYFVADPAGSTQYGGVAYAPYAGPLAVQFSTVSDTAPFAGGTVAGFVSQFLVVPEPATVFLAVAAAAGLGWRRPRGGAN